MTIPCCDYLDFKRGLLAHWQRDKHKPAMELIDWRQAKRDHKRGMTGMESAFMQLRKLREDG